MIKELCEKINFPAEDAEYFEECLSKILSDSDSASMFFDAHEDYFVKAECYHDLLDKISELHSIHRYTIDMTFLLYCARTLYCIYKNKGYDDELFYSSMHDLLCKLNECKELYGIRGTFVFKRWFRRFFLTTLFGFGRLEIGVVPFPHDEYRGVKHGDVSFDCHIPSGGRLLVEDVYASLKKAYAFYKEQGILKGDIMTVNCHSWILYPDTVKVFAENSNLRKFAELFDVLRTEDDPTNEDFWRIFGVEFDENFEKAPQDTSLRRNLVAYIKNGGNMGAGIGVLQFDGEKIVKI